MRACIPLDDARALMMMRARRVVTTIARRASMSLGVAVAVTMAQAVTLTATYSTAPEARGPRRGVIGFEDDGTGDDGDDDDDGGRRPVISRWMTTRSIGSGGRDDGERSRSRRRRRLVAFVAGDSTACGVGCASAYETPTPTDGDEDDTKGEGVRRARDGGGGDEDEEIGGRRGRFLGPTLARAFAARASERLRADVEWRALGFKGADVRGLRDKLIPSPQINVMVSATRPVASDAL